MKHKGKDIILSERDQEIMFWLTRMGHMASIQINKCISSKMTIPALSKRLRALENYSVIKSFGGYHSGFRRLPKVYSITEKGYKLLQDVAILELPPFKHVKAPQWSSLFWHRQLVVDTVISLNDSLKKNSELKNNFTFVDYRIDGKGNPETSDEFLDSDGKIIKLVPDMVFAIKGKNNSFLYFVEVDRGTESIESEYNYSSIKKKLNKYERYLITRSFVKKYGQYDTFLLLLITKTERRNINISKVLEQFSILKNVTFFKTIDEIKIGFIETSWLHFEDKIMTRKYFV